MVRELSATALALGAEVFTTSCESHTSQVPFHAVARLLRAATGVTGLDAQAARVRLRQNASDADPEDVLLLADLLGISDPAIPLPRIDPDARRRRLTALVKAAQMARVTPALYIVEDIHWIDEVSESMLTEFISVIAQTPALVIVTYRPEYAGALTHVDDAQTLVLEPLSDSETGTLVAQLLGSDPTVTAMSRIIVERASGTPFFAEEMVRDLAERGVLQGEAGAYRSTTTVVEVTVPATLQAIIGARIDRLGPEAKRTLTAAAVVGSRFGVELLTTLGVEPEVDALLTAQLVDQVRFAHQPEYTFHHPLIRAVAYESQLRSDRAEMHRRVAAALEQRESASVDENAALIAEHRKAAGDLHAAYGWHMRAATWARGRDITAARLSWERARTIADALPTEDQNRAAMRIAPRAMLCATAYRLRAHGAAARFAELRKLCTGAGDKPSLAIAMAGLVMDHAYQGQIRQASQLASEAMALIESVGDETLTVGLSYPAIYAKTESGEYADVLQWSQRVVDLASGDPFKGNFIFGSPLALALTSRATARYCLGLPGWRHDLRDGIGMAHTADPLTYAAVVVLGYFPGSPMACCVPMIAQCVRARMLYGLPNGPAMTWHWPSLGSPWELRWCIVAWPWIVIAGRCSWPRSARCWSARDITLRNFRSSTSTWAENGFAMVTLTRRYRRCALPSTSWPTKDNCRPGELRRQPLSRRHCSIVRRRAISTSLRPSSIDWPPLRPTTYWWCATSGYCGYVHCWPEHEATRVPTGTIGSATARWQQRWASKDIWRSPRRCHDVHSHRGSPEPLKALPGIRRSNGR